MNFQHQAFFQTSRPNKEKFMELLRLLFFLMIVTYSSYMNPVCINPEYKFDL